MIGLIGQLSIKSSVYQLFDRVPPRENAWLRKAGFCLPFFHLLFLLLITTHISFKLTKCSDCLIIDTLKNKCCQILFLAWNSIEVSSATGVRRRIMPLISESTAILAYNTLIQPHFDYCSLVWDGLSSKLRNKLQQLQSRAARAILKADYDTSSNLLLEILKWDRLEIRRKKQNSILVVLTDLIL